MMHRSFRPGVALVAVLLAACGSDEEASSTIPPVTGPDTIAVTVPTTSIADDLGGFGAQVAEPGEFPSPMPTPIVARLDRDDRGCWSLRAGGTDVFVILPAGFEADPGGEAMIGPDGAVIPAGSTVEATGEQFRIDDLPGGADGRWGNFAAFCRPSADLAVALETVVADDFDPAALDDEAVAALIAGAEFELDWPCGYGFATSTEDQAVGLYVDPADFEAPAPGAISLPDDGWRATVVVGRHLFVNHCDDVVEWFEPDPERVVSYELSAGSFDFAPPPPGSSGDEPVAIVIEGAVVDGPTGPIPLGALTIENAAYGFFAG